MVRRTFTGLVQLLGGLGAGLAIIALLVAWQLHKGPVSLSFLTPYVEQALNSGHRNFRLAIDDTTLTWAGWDRAVALRVKNVRAIGEGGTAVARIPELSLSLSGIALLQGKLAPKNIELLGPEFRISRSADGTFGIRLAAETDTANGRVAAGLLGWLIKEPDAGSPMSYLDTVRVSGANMTFDDRVSGRVWEVPVGYLRLDRAPFGLQAEGSFLVDIESRVADIAVNGTFHTVDKRLDLTATFADIAPASFAPIYEKFEAFRVADLPLSGSFVVGMTLGEGLHTVGFNIEGKAGNLRLPAPFDQTLAVETIAMRGLFDGDSDTTFLDKVEITFAEGSSLNVPAPISHTFPLRNARFSGHFERSAGRLDISNLDLDLAGPAFAMTGAVEGIDTADPIRLRAETTLKNVQTVEVTRYWPKALGTDAYNWVTGHMTDGRMIRADAKLDAEVGTDGAVKINDLDGTMTAEGVTVTYLEGMPPVYESAALMTFDETSFDIAVERGHRGNVNVIGGTVHISGLDVIDQYADVDLRIETELGEALTLIDHEPLGFAKAMGLKPKSTEGKATVDLQMRFLLAKDLAMSDVEVNAEAELFKVAMDDVVLGRSIRNGRLHLSVDKEGMEVSGDVRMGEIPVTLTWEDRFVDDAPFKTRYVMSAPIDDVRNVRDLGVDPGPLAADMISGGVDTTVRYTVFDKRSARVDINADIARAEIRVPALDWRKDAGDKGWAAVTILLENGVVKNVPSFEVTSDDLSVKGDIAYSAGGLGLERINLQRVLFGRTNVTGAVIARADGSWEVGLQGDELDFTPLWERLIGDRPGHEETDLPDLTIAVEIGKLWVDRERFLGDVSGTFVHHRDIWRTVLLDSKINGQSLLNINMAPDETGNRILALRADDAGGALRFLDLFGNMYGGKLEINGRYDDAAPDRPLRGKLRVRDYRVRNAPLLTRILSIMALTGILDALTGDGLNFNELDIPFTATDGEVRINDAKATGTSIGFTASGTVYTHADVLNLEGTVVPVYAVNSFLGKIPLLGNILTGQEEGGGIFAANFSVAGPMEDPKTTVNPLSALTPGILRNLFGALGSGAEPIPDTQGGSDGTPAKPTVQ